MQGALRRLVAAVCQAAWLALFLFGAPAAKAEITIGPQEDVPWLAAVLPETVSLALLADGSFAIAGTEIVELVPQQEEVSFLVQFFDARGLAKGNPVTVLAGNFAIDGGVGSLGDRYLVTRSRFFEGKTEAVFYNGEGTRFGKVLAWPYSAIPTFHLYYRYGQAPTWRFLPLTFFQRGTDRDHDPFFYQPRLQVAGPDARPLGPAVPLAPRRWIDIADLAINGQGRFVVLGTQCAKDPNTSKPCVFAMQIFDGAGQPQSGLSSRGLPREGAGEPAFGGFSIAINAAGRMALTWVTDIFEPVERLVARLYDENGAVVSAVLPVAVAESLASLRRGIRALDDGNFVLAWDVASFTDGVNMTIVFLRELDAEARQTLPPAIVAMSIPGGSWFELNGSGHGVVAWLSDDSTPQGVTRSAHFRLVTVHGGEAATEQAARAKP